MEQIILAPVLDIPVPLMEEQLLVDAFAPHGIRVREQVIEVPKILFDELPVRNLVREPAAGGTAGGEVPTIISFSSLQRIVEQNVDIPVPFLRRLGLGFWLFFSCRMEKYAQSMLRFEPLHALFALGVQGVPPK